MGVLQKAKTIKSKCKAAKPVSSTKVVLKKITSKKKQKNYVLTS